MAKALVIQAIRREFRSQNPLQTCMAAVVKGRSEDPRSKLASEASHNL